MPQPQNSNGNGKPGGPAGPKGPNGPQEPEITDQLFFIDEDAQNGAAVGHVAASDPDGDDLSYSIVSGNEDGIFAIDPLTGEIALVDNSQLDYETQASYELVVAVEDKKFSTTATITIDLNDVNEAPIASDFSASTDEDTILTAYFAVSDQDIGDTTFSLSYTIVDDPAKGSVLMNSDGTFDFDPGTDFQGLSTGESEDVSFTYFAMDAGGLSTETRTATITVAGLDDAPTAADQSASIDEDQTLTLAFAAADVDAADSQETLSYSVIDGPSKGHVTINTDGTFTFDPVGEFDALVDGESEQVNFTYQAKDSTNLTSEVRTVTITIDGVGAGTGDQFEPVLAVGDLDGTNGFTIFGSDGIDDTQDLTRDFLGWSVSGVGDINNDGYDDVVASSYARADGSGEAWIIFGSSAPFPNRVGEDYLDGTLGFVFEGSGINDQLGYSVSEAGDVNNDGIDDLLIGARNGGDENQGAAYVVYGTEDGFSARMSADDLDGSNGFAIQGRSGNNGLIFGYNVSAAGDLNGDGVDDIIIADQLGYNLASEGYSIPEVYVVLGSENLSDPLLSVDDLDGSNGFAVRDVSAELFTEGGFINVSGAGDVNGDGIDDLIIGMPLADPDGTLNNGSAFIVFGSADGFAPVIDLSLLDGSNGFTVKGYHPSGQLGRVSSAGDINGDGIDDLVIGADVADDLAPYRGGEVYVIFGTDQGFDAEVDVSALDGANGFLIAGIDGGDLLGRSVSSAGDVNGDGIDDLLIGAPGADGEANSGSASGEAYVIFGSTAGFDSLIDLEALDGSNGFRIDGDDNPDLFGSIVDAAGDVNGDGVDDLIVGAYNATVDGEQGAGEAYVIYGRDTFEEALSVTSLPVADADLI